MTLTRRLGESIGLEPMRAEAIKRYAFGCDPLRVTNTRNT
jgi:hypothetical protein